MFRSCWLQRYSICEMQLLWLPVQVQKGIWPIPSYPRT